MQTLATDRPGRQQAPIVGRRPELEELTAVLADAAGGSGALVLVEGEAGIGKTRLAETLGEQAAAAGHSVLWGAAWDAGGAPAYWPWTQVVRALLAERPADELREDLGAGAPYVAQIAADVARVVPVAESAPPLDSEAGRFAAFDATASFLRAAATRRPLVVVLDDLHAADVSTLLLLEFLARGMHGARILAVGTCRVDPGRGEDEAAAALAQAGRAAKRLALGGLTRAAVEELTARYAGGPPAPELVDRLHQLTEGNPLFLDEVLRLLRADGTLTAPGAARFRIPQAVRGTIRRRLAPLAPDVVETLTTAAVIGPEFGFDALMRSTGADRATVLRQLDAAAVVGLVRLSDPAHPGSRYRFGHALVRETLYDDLPAHERVARHAAVGEAMLAGGGDPPLSELAYHLLQAAPGGGALRASDYAERAARAALESMAYEQAIDLFAAALAVLADDPAGRERRGPLLLAQGGAEIAAGRLETGRETLRAAAA
jgi:eukaryotic-like serine/threonine-protein kinase